MLNKQKNIKKIKCIIENVQVNAYDIVTKVATSTKASGTGSNLERDNI